MFSSTIYGQKILREKQIIRKKNNTSWHDKIYQRESNKNKKKQKKHKKILDKNYFFKKQKRVDAILKFKMIRNMESYLKIINKSKYIYVNYKCFIF